MAPTDRIVFADISSTAWEHPSDRVALNALRELRGFDTVLRKLEWYRLGREVSDRQWNDILGVIRTQGDRLDFDYLRHWASELGVADLLERALTAT